MPDSPTLAETGLARITTLGPLKITVGEQSVVFGRKLPRKPLSLLKILVAQGGESVPEQRVTQAIWPADSTDSTYQAFWLSLHRLRKILGRQDTIELTGGRLSINRSRVWVDAFAFEEALDGDDPSGPAIEQAIKLYQGPLFDGDDDYACVLLARERIRRKLVHSVGQRGHFLETNGRCGQARELYQKGLDCDPLSEGFHQGLIRCLLAEQRLTEAVFAYRNLRRLLSVTLGRPPSRETESLVANFVSPDNG